MSGWQFQEPHPNPVAVIGLSVVLPGLGSIYTRRDGQMIAGGVILGIYVTAWVLTLVLIGWVIIPLAWLAGMIAALAAVFSPRTAYPARTRHARA